MCVVTIEWLIWLAALVPWLACFVMLLWFATVKWSLTNKTVINESKHEKGAGADLTKWLEAQFVVVVSCFFFLISSEFLSPVWFARILAFLVHLLCCIYFCSYLFEFTGHQSFLHEADVADWIWLMHGWVMTWPCNLVIFSCATGTPVISSALCLCTEVLQSWHADALLLQSVLPLKSEFT